MGYCTCFTWENGKKIKRNYLFELVFTYKDFSYMVKISSRSNKCRSCWTKTSFTWSKILFNRFKILIKIDSFLAFSSSFMCSSNIISWYSCSHIFTSKWWMETDCGYKSCS
jgi:hypothetical protein